MPNKTSHFDESPKMRLKNRPRKTRLSEALERRFVHAKLKPQEVTSIRNMADSYQEGRKVRWNSREFALYQSYFGFLTALKAKSAVEELANFGFLKEAKEIEILDIGAGTLGASLGIVDALNDYQIKVKRVVGVDPQESAFRWARKEFS